MPLGPREQSGHNTVRVKVENPKKNTIEIKQYSDKDDTEIRGLDNVSERLLHEMKELRDKYNKNFLELQNLKEKQKSDMAAKKLQHEISQIERFIINSLVSDVKVLQQTNKRAGEILQITYAELIATNDKLLALQNENDKLTELTRTQIKMKPTENQVKSGETAKKLVPAQSMAAQSIRTQTNTIPVQSATARQIKSSTETVEDDIYEVDKLVDHQIKGKVRYFLVRWKGFSETHDTWEKESNLSCPILMNAYKTAKKLKK